MISETSEQRPMMKRKPADEKVTIGQIDKSATEIVRVERQLLNGHELISLKVFSCRRTKAGAVEKGLSLHLEQWREVLPMIEAGLEIKFSENTNDKSERLGTPISPESGEGPVPFDPLSWRAKIKEAFSQITEAYPAGCLDWLRKSDPGRISELKATVKEAERAYLAKNAQELQAALDAYRRAHQLVFEEFRRKSE